MHLSYFTLIFLMFEVLHSFRRFNSIIRNRNVFQLLSTRSTIDKSHDLEIKSSIKSYVVSHNSDLMKAVSYLKNCTEIGLDLEFDRNGFAYGFNLCLIQVYGNNNIYLFDPIETKLDMSPLFRKILENKNILKIIHAPSEDIKLLRTLNCSLVNIFDTERCAKLLNYQYSSLLYLLNQTMGVEINKSEQKSNWLRRPLTPSQLEYAKIDVLHLIDLKNKLLKLIIEKGIPIDWINQENDDWTSGYDQLLKSNNSIQDEDEKSNFQFTSKKDAKIFSPYQLNILNSIMTVREKYAKRFGKPPFYILSKEAMYDIVFDEPSKLNIHLRRGINPKLKDLSISHEFENYYQKALQECKTNSLSKILVKVNESAITAELKQLNIIKARVSELYGNYTANFILPITLMQKINSMNNIDAFMNNDSILLYRRCMIRDIMNELNIDIFNKNNKSHIDT